MKKKILIIIPIGLLLIVATLFFTVHSWTAANCVSPEKCTICGKTRGKALGHTYDNGVVTTEPTCTSEGVRTFTCSRCTATREEAIAVMDHQYENVTIKAATCQEEGIIEVTCKVCGFVNGTKTLSKTGHSYESETTTEPTYTEPGIKTETCKICGYVRTSNIPVKPADITVTVLNKVSHEPNYSAFIYTNYVTFNIKVENQTDTDIRGISGYFIINDLFGNKILSLGCDFTGTIIPAGEYAEFDDMSVDINQFIEADLKLYNEKYEDLEFQYIVDNVVYNN